MSIPLQIAFPDFPPSDAVIARVRAKVDKLGRYYDRIVGCQVMIGYVNKRHHTGNIYRVIVELDVPGARIVYSDAHENGNTAHKDVYVAIRDAFQSVGRRLQDYVRQRRPRLHTNAPQAAPAQGTVVRLVPEAPEEGYGFLHKDGPGEGDIYFNAHSVLNRQFARLKVGSRVRFAEEQGENGPQASTVELIAA